MRKKRYILILANDFKVWRFWNAFEYMVYITLYMYMFVFTLSCITLFFCLFFFFFPNEVGRKGDRSEMCASLHLEGKHIEAVTFKCVRKKGGGQPRMQYENSFYASVTVTVIILPKIHTSMLTCCMLLLSFHLFCVSFIFQSSSTWAARLLWDVRY